MPAESDGSAILIVDDDPDLRQVLGDVLRDRGHSVGAVGDGRQGIRYLETAAVLPRLILLDLNMPRADGSRFREQQLARAAWAAIPTLIMTGDVHVFDRVASLRAAGVVRKPIEVEPLLELVDRLLK